MPYSNDDGLMPAIEKILRDSGQPMSCHELFDMGEIRERAASANRVSDYLGHMWRRGVLTRLSAPSGTRARWMYQWHERKLKPGPPEPEYKPLATEPKPAGTALSVARRPETTARGAPITIADVHGELTLETQDFTIVIRRKN